MGPTIPWEAVLGSSGPVVLLLLVLRVLWIADDAISGDFRRDLSAWMSQVRPVQIAAPTVIGAIQGIFIRVYGPRQFSMRCLVRVALLSSFVCLLFCLPGIYLRVQHLLRGGDPEVIARQALASLSFFVVVVLPANAMADFLSIGQTRLFLRWAVHRRVPLWLLFVADALVSVSLFALTLLSVYTLRRFDGGLELADILAAFNEIRAIVLNGLPELGQYFGGTAQTDFVSVYFTYVALLLLGGVATSLLPSLWMAGALWGNWMSHVLSRSQRLQRALIYALPIDKRPMRAAAMALGLVTLPPLAAWVQVMA